MLQNAKSYSGDDTCTYNPSFSSQITFEIDSYHISSHVTKCKIIQRGRHLYLEFFFQLSNSLGTQFTSYLKSCYKIQNITFVNVVPTLSLAIFQKKLWISIHMMLNGDIWSAVWSTGIWESKTQVVDSYDIWIQVSH